MAEAVTLHAVVRSHLEGMDGNPELGPERLGTVRLVPGPDVDSHMGVGVKDLTGQSDVPSDEYGHAYRPEPGEAIAFCVGEVVWVKTLMLIQGPRREVGVDRGSPVAEVVGKTRSDPVEGAGAVLCRDMPILQIRSKEQPWQNEVSDFGVEVDEGRVGVVADIAKPRDLRAAAEDYDALVGCVSLGAQ